jgi:uncharacterized protein GlcG (DUF336 family)
MCAKIDPGHLRAFERTDGAPFLTACVAVDKGWSFRLGWGYPITEEGNLIGGIGISGGNY